MTLGTERRLPSLPPPMVSRPVRPPRSEEAAKPHSKAAGRFGVLNEFVDCSLEGLTRAGLVVWLILYRDTRGNRRARDYCTKQWTPAYPLLPPDSDKDCKSWGLVTTGLRMQNAQNNVFARQNKRFRAKKAKLGN